MRLSSMYNHFHVIYTRSLGFPGQNILFYSQNDFWCYILWLLEYIIFFIEGHANLECIGWWLYIILLLNEMMLINVVW